MADKTLNNCFRLATCSIGLQAVVPGKPRSLKSHQNFVINSIDRSTVFVIVYALNIFDVILFFERFDSQVDMVVAK